jgi:hypothetical protein
MKHKLRTSALALAFLGGAALTSAPALAQEVYEDEFLAMPPPPAEYLYDEGPGLNMMDQPETFRGEAAESPAAAPVPGAFDDGWGLAREFPWEQQGSTVE